MIKRLEEVLALSRDEWPPSALRALWEPMHDVADARFQSARHESRWLNLAGFCLRPGTGFPLDEVRIKALWPVFHAGVRHVKDMQCWAEWWIAWRRVAAGLNKAHHDEIYRRVVPLLLPGKGGPPRKLGRPRPEAHELAEMWRCAAALERLAAPIKEALGDVLIKEVARPTIPPHALWCLGRLGARVPLYGPANTVVPAEKAESWVRALMNRKYAPGRETADAIFAFSQIARKSGDRARDIDIAVGPAVVDFLSFLGAGERAWLTIMELHELEDDQQSQALGDALPVGLRLLNPIDEPSQ